MAHEQHSAFKGHFTCDLTASLLDVQERIHSGEVCCMTFIGLLSRPTAAVWLSLGVKATWLGLSSNRFIYVTEDTSLKLIQNVSLLTDKS